MKRLLAVSLTLALMQPALADAAVTLDPARVPARTQITLRYSDGREVGTANAHESRPALSIIKLHLGYWVLHNGTPADKAVVEEMIRVSHDGIASRLDRTYPQAISEVIAQHGLGETHYNGYWGNSTASTHDTARLLEVIANDPVSEPIRRGMRNASPVAADGYKQDFGTARVPGVWGSKFGWADERNVHASASLGNGFSIAANTYGSPGDLTADVLGAVRVVPDAPAPKPAPWQPAPKPAAPQPSALEARILPLVPAPWREQVRQWIRAFQAQFPWFK